MMAGWIRLGVALWLAMVFSAGCVTRTEYVRVPCIGEELPPPPKYADDGDAILRAADPAARYQIVAAANEQKGARLALVEPAISGCRLPPGQ